MYLNGLPIVILENKKVQNRTHKKKRINKKWAKRYGFTIQRPYLEDGKILTVDGKLIMNEYTYIKLNNQLQKEKMTNEKSNNNEGLKRLFGF